MIIGLMADKNSFSGVFGVFGVFNNGVLPVS
jgi:hypothetical protein